MLDCIISLCFVKLGIRELGEILKFFNWKIAKNMEALLKNNKRQTWERRTLHSCSVGSA